MINFYFTLYNFFNGPGFSFRVCFFCLNLLQDKSFMTFYFHKKARRKACFFMMYLLFEIYASQAEQVTKFTIISFETEELL